MQQIHAEQPASTQAQPANRIRAWRLLLPLLLLAGLAAFWLAVWGRPLAGSQPDMQMPGMATQQQINELQTLPVAAMETSFLQLMIRHHQGGVAMAQAALRQTRRPEVAPLAMAIVQGQQSEISYMEQLLKQRGAAPLPSTEPMQTAPGSQ